MRFPIDIVFLDRERRILAVSEEMRPFRAAWKWGAREVLELPAGEVDRIGLRPGHRLAWGKHSPGAEPASA